MPEDLTLADIWTGLHADARSYDSVPEGLNAAQSRAAIDENSVSVLGALAECPAPRWRALIDCLGETQYGAIALSWCKGVAFEDVVGVFEALKLDPGQLDRRALSLLAPQHGASERRLSKLVELADQDMGALTLLCLGDPAPLVMDVSDDWLASLPDWLRDLLGERAGGAG